MDNKKNNFDSEASSSPNTNPELLARIKDNSNEAAWREFIQIYRPLVYGFCINHQLQVADANDVTQEVMKAISRSIANFEYDPKKGRFRSWLFTVTRSKFNNFLESRYKHPQGSGDTEMLRFIEDQPAREEAEDWDKEFKRQTLASAMEAVELEFAPKTWEAFVRTAIHHEPGKDVADELDLSVGAVYIARSRVTTRIKEWVRRFLKDETDFFDDLDPAT
jgi:RNA polymerase sigma-70 factor (ECF subfamily)